VARLGARRLLHGPGNAVVPAAAIEEWLSQLIGTVTADAPRQTLFAITSLSRWCGVRDYDVDESLRDRALDLLRREHAPTEWCRQLTELSDDSAAYRAELAGDALPLGLSLTMSVD
jgi:hypothetical protein